MYDFKEYCKGSPNKIPDDVDIFRHDPPQYVIDRSKCFQELYTNPDNWRNILRKYKIRLKTIEKLGNFPNLTSKNIKKYLLRIKLKNKDYYDTR